MKDMKWFEDMEARIPHGEVRTRFAPSPTGYMHVGNLRTALYTYLIARHAGGKFILRIEDTDQGRLVEGAVDVIYKTMAECHLEHDEGPDVGGPVGPYVHPAPALYGPVHHRDAGRPPRTAGAGAGGLSIAAWQAGNSLRLCGGRRGAGTGEHTP